MANLVSNATVDATNLLTPTAVTGSQMFTFSGTLGPLNKLPVIEIFSRSDTADFAPVHHQSGFGRFQINFVNGDDYFYIITVNGATVDLAAVDV